MLTEEQALAVIDIIRGLPIGSTQQQSEPASWRTARSQPSSASPNLRRRWREKYEIEEDGRQFVSVPVDVYDAYLSEKADKAG